MAAKVPHFGGKGIWLFYAILQEIRCPQNSLTTESQFFKKTLTFGAANNFTLKSV